MSHFCCDLFNGSTEGKVLDDSSENNYKDPCTELPDNPGPVLFIDNCQKVEQTQMDDDPKTVILEVDDNLALLRSLPKLPTVTNFIVKHTNHSTKIVSDYKRALEQSFPNMTAFEVDCCRWDGDLGFDTRHLAQFVPSIATLRKLENIRIHASECPSSFVFELPNLHRLTRLLLSAKFHTGLVFGDCPSLKELQLFHNRRDMTDEVAIDISLLSKLQKLEIYAAGDVCIWKVKAAPSNGNLRTLVLHKVNSFDGDLSEVVALELNRCKSSSRLMDACQESLRELFLGMPVDEESFVIDATNLNVLALLDFSSGTGFVKEVIQNERSLEALLLHGVVFENEGHAFPPIRTRRLVLSSDSSSPYEFFTSRVALQGVQCLVLNHCIPSPCALEEAIVLSILQPMQHTLVLFATNILIRSLPEMPQLQWLCLPNFSTYKVVLQHLSTRPDAVGFLKDSVNSGQHLRDEKALFGRYLDREDLYDSAYHFCVQHVPCTTSLPAAFDFGTSSYASGFYNKRLKINLVTNEKCWAEYYA